MTLSELKTTLDSLETLNFRLPDGSMVDSHFHVTEVGELTKRFIDCGGTLRQDRKISLQLWKAEDYDHRLAPQKLKGILELSEAKLGLPDANIVVEYQGATIQQYNLDLDGDTLVLTSLFTDCLAKDACDIPEKVKVDLSSLTSTACCSPDS